MPWSHHVVAEEVPEGEGRSPTNQYRNYWGYEVDMLREAAAMLDFDFELRNPPDGLWAGVLPNGSYSGLIGKIAYGDGADFAISDMLMTSNRHQVRNCKADLMFCF